MLLGRASVVIREVNAQVMMMPSKQPNPAYKRLYDLLLVGVFSVLFPYVWIPAWVIVPLLVLAIDGRPVFYTQDRVGKDGRVFRMIKFRTMARDVESATGPTLPKAKDPRATGLGKILRMTSLDEAPQIINILRGEMSLVGPRPERPEMVDLIKEQVPDYDQRLRTLPGVAGLDHIRGNFNYRNRLRYDNFYIERMSPWFDLVIIAWSLQTIARRLTLRKGKEGIMPSARVRLADDMVCRQENGPPPVPDAGE